MLQSTHFQTTFIRHGNLRAHEGSTWLFLYNRSNRVSKSRDVLSIANLLVVLLPRQSASNRSSNAELPVRQGPCLGFSWAYRRALSYDSDCVWNRSRLWILSRRNNRSTKSIEEKHSSQPVWQSTRVGMAAPRPIKGILKNRNSGTNVKSLSDEVPAENPEQSQGLSEDDQK